MKLNETSLHFLHVARVSVPRYQIISLYHAMIPVPRWMLPDLKWLYHQFTVPSYSICTKIPITSWFEHDILLKSIKQIGNKF